MMGRRLLRVFPTTVTFWPEQSRFCYESFFINFKMPFKDVITRYASSTGHHVARRFGWDCHGLPVEYEIDKKLG